MLKKNTLVMEVIVRVSCELCGMVKDFYSERDAEHYRNGECSACQGGKSVSWSAGDDPKASHTT